MPVTRIPIDTSAAAITCAWAPHMARTWSTRAAGAAGVVSPWRARRRGQTSLQRREGSSGTVRCSHRNWPAPDQVGRDHRGVRADRLVATLLFLQSRGRVTAAEVADELEVSIRTARRDLEALSIAGIPVYSQAGRGGGWSLVGGARTDLSGLTATEARTLFLVAGPSSAVTPAAKAALRKLVQALPETFRAEAEKAASAIVLDPSGWAGRAPSTPPHLETLQRAVIEGVQIRL